MSGVLRIERTGGSVGRGGVLLGAGWRTAGSRRRAQYRPRDETRSVARAEPRVGRVRRSAGGTAIHQVRTWLRPLDLARYSASSARAKKILGRVYARRRKGGDADADRQMERLLAARVERVALDATRGDARRR